MVVVGVDCATNDRKVGVALGEYRSGRLTVLEARACSRQDSTAKVVGDWLASAPVALLALDAPLGWPAALGEELSRHEAGEVIGTEKNTIFRRETDRSVRERTGKTPLDVGADRIARTAHYALELLDALRKTCGIPIPLAWDATRVAGVSAIEVYPAATLTVRGLRASGYKNDNQRAEREGIVESLQQHLDVKTASGQMHADADVLDAVVCLLAAQDFRTAALIRR